MPELYAAVFGTLKAGCVTGPLFSAFGPDAVGDRLADAGAKVLVTSPDLRAKVQQMRPNLPDLKHVIIVEHGKEPALEPGELSWNDLIADASDEFEIEHTGPEDPSVMHYTSGTTGKPKGAAHVHQAVLGPLRHRQVRARPPRRRHLLVHRRPGLGDGHLVRHVRAVDATA